MLAGRLPHISKCECVCAWARAPLRQNTYCNNKSEKFKRLPYGHEPTRWAICRILLLGLDENSNDTHTPKRVLWRKELARARSHPQHQMHRGRLSASCTLTNKEFEFFCLFAVLLFPRVLHHVHEIVCKEFSRTTIQIVMCEKAKRGTGKIHMHTLTYCLRNGLQYSLAYRQDVDCHWNRKIKWVNFHWKTVCAKQMLQ